MWRRSRPTACHLLRGDNPTFPLEHEQLLARCHAAGQRRPTPPILRYGKSDWNALHQDLYGEVFFPFQILTILSRCGEDFDGGEFVLLEQRPRAQSRAHVLAPPQGAFIIFPTAERPNRGNNGYHRVRYDRGWEFVHVAIDDATRLAYVEVLDDERVPTAIGFLRRAVKHFRSYGITVERLITDNGNAYRSTAHAIACRALGIRHLRTRPYRPQTNGKAERFIRTMLGGWAYGAIYRDSAERNAALAGWLDFYNRRRPHSALSHKPPIARLQELNNLLRNYS